MFKNPMIQEKSLLGELMEAKIVIMLSKNVGQLKDYSKEIEEIINTDTANYTVKQAETIILISKILESCELGFVYGTKNEDTDLDNKINKILNTPRQDKDSLKNLYEILVELNKLQQEEFRSKYNPENIGKIQGFMAPPPFIK